MTTVVSSIGFVILVFAAIWLRFAWRGRVVGDQPCCQRSGYQPGAEASDEATCPECAWRGRMSIGFRRRSKRAILAAGLLAFVGIVATCWPIIGPRVPMTSADIYAILPDWLLVRSVDFGGSASAEVAAERVFEDTLSTASERKLIDTFIALYADTTRPLDNAWSDALLLCFVRGRMSPEQEIAYIKATHETGLQIRSIVPKEATTQAYQFLVSGRYPRMDAGGIPFSPRDVTVEAAIQDLRDSAIRSIRIEEILINGESVEEMNSDGDSPWLPYGSGYEFGGRIPVPADPPESGWTVSVRATIAVSMHGKERARWSVTDTRRARLGETPIPVIRDEQIVAKSIESIRAIRLAVKPVPNADAKPFSVSGDTFATLTLGMLEPLPHGITGAIEIVTPSGSRLFDSKGTDGDGVLIYPMPTAGMQNKHFSTTWRRGDADGAIAFWSELRNCDKVDIIFHSDPSVAFDPLRLKSVINLSMRFRDVPVIATEKAPPIQNSAPPDPAWLNGVPAERLLPESP